MNYEIYNEDCIAGMKRLADNSVDMILTDLPYGITAAPFDVRIPFEPMWEQFKRVTKRNAVIALFSQMPFGAELIMSNKKMFRYEWIWEKNLASGFLNARKMPLNCHENILIFYQQLPTYNPQWFFADKYRQRHMRYSDNYNIYKNGKKICETSSEDGRRYPRNVQKFKVVMGGDCKVIWHPTQKPTDLLEYLIKTYTDEGETVLDATMGSGSTGVAAINTGRNFIGFELEQKFFDIARKRIDDAIAAKAQSLF